MYVCIYLHTVILQHVERKLLNVAISSALLYRQTQALQQQVACHIPTINPAVSSSKSKSSATNIHLYINS